MDFDDAMGKPTTLPWGVNVPVEYDGGYLAHLPLSEHAPRDLGRHVFMINTRDFMDPWTFNVKNAMKCCVEFLIPDGRMIPFCTYNTVGYREQVTASLRNKALAAD